MIILCSLICSVVLGFSLYALIWLLREGGHLKGLEARAKSWWPTKEKPCKS